MNIAIIGATGMVGARTAAEAISRGHRVDAYTRSGNAPEGATAHSIDLSDTAALVDVVNSHDVTIVAVPGGRGTSAQPIIDAHRALIAAAPTGRLLVVGGAGSLEDGNGNRFVDGEGFRKITSPRRRHSPRFSTSTTHPRV